GTNDESRIGKALTGGCINAGKLTMGVLLDTVELGDQVVISSDSPCLP
ncbi:MAG: L,D-transpeptidase, partial [Synechococcus sp.]